MKLYRVEADRELGRKLIPFFGIYLLVTAISFSAWFFGYPYETAHGGYRRHRFCPEEGFRTRRQALRAMRRAK